MAIVDCPSSTEPPTEPPDSAENVEDPSHEPPPIYPLHKITTTTIGEMMHFHGTINNLPINIFIDCGSVMNFLNPSIAYKLNLPISKPTSLQFSTASGQTISPSGLTLDVTVTIQGYEFTGSFLLLPVTGCDLLLGAQWLNTFGFIGWHFAEKVMMFTTNGKCHILHGLTSQSPSIYHTRFCSLLPADHLEDLQHHHTPVVPLQFNLFWTLFKTSFLHP